MPTPNTSSPVKRPGLGRRAISSHAVVARSQAPAPVTVEDLSRSYDRKERETATTTAQAHRPHRPHIVGGGHRTHARNPSFGKNLAKLQRLNSSTHFGAEGSGRNHNRKKSSQPPTPASESPATSPRGSQHVHWEGVVEKPEKPEKPKTTESMRKNNSTPALRRNLSGGLVKKSLLADAATHAAVGKKKTVGFELGESDNDDGDWEDTTQSPESTRRSSVAVSTKDNSADNSAVNSAILVDPLTFVKRPFPQLPRATSLPETRASFSREGQASDDEDDEDDHDESQQETSPDTEGQSGEESSQAPDHGDIANRLLSPSHAAKAPPAMSSISAVAEQPNAVDTISRNTSLTNLSAAHDGTRRMVSATHPAMASTPGSQIQATSSSIEAGVSRFIINTKSGIHASSRTDSDPNTPSSFLPHYHPQTPPSPNRGSSSKKSPSSRAPGTEPPSRTQQKLWLQRTAALNTTPPDNHGVSTAASPSVMDPAFMAAAHGRGGSGTYDSGRGIANGGGRAGGGAVHDSDTKHIRKTWEKTALELTVVRRFQSPTGDSFGRLIVIMNESRDIALGSGRKASALGKPVKSAPALTQLQDEIQSSRGQNDSSPEPRQLIGRKAPEMRTSASHVYLQEPGDLVKTSDSTDLALRPKSQHPSHRILSTSDEGAHEGTSNAAEDLEDDQAYYTNETEMMIRRMWESREVAISG